MMKQCVVVPIYKQIFQLSKNEISSLTQLLKVLGTHKIFLIGPSTIIWADYEKHVSNKNTTADIKVFNSSYFTGLEGYNRLMLSTEFYKSFSKYDYILIYQTDAFVFKDELNYWCGREFDYIGAPWFKGLKNPDQLNEITGVGNGGFSLRNVHSAMRLLRRINFIKTLRSFWFKTHLQGLVRYERLILFFNGYFKLKEVSLLPQIIFGPYGNEDHYWSQVMAKVFTDFNVAPVDEAIKFSFEVNPSFLFKMNNNKLPFGCHGFDKYEVSFWDEIIKAGVNA